MICTCKSVRKLKKCPNFLTSSRKEIDPHDKDKSTYVPSVTGTVSKNEPRLFDMHLLEASWDSEAMFPRCIQGWQGTQRWVCGYGQTRGLSNEQGYCSSNRLFLLGMSLIFYIIVFHTFQLQSPYHSVAEWACPESQKLHFFHGKGRSITLFEYFMLSQFIATNGIFFLGQ